MNLRNKKRAFFLKSFKNQKSTSFKKQDWRAVIFVYDLQYDEIKHEK